MNGETPRASPSQVAGLEVRPFATGAGQLVVLRRPARMVGKPGGGIRGVVTGLSRASSGRLVRSILRTQGSQWRFITLTVGRTFAGDFRRCRKRICEWLRRHGVAGYWAFGVQENGRAHLHILTVCELGAAEEDELRTFWHRLSEAAPNRHSVDVRPAPDLSCVAVYLARNAEAAGKVMEGRLWGRFGTLEQVPARVPLVSGELSELAPLIRTLRKAERAARRKRGMRALRDRGTGRRKFRYCVAGVRRILPDLLAFHGFAFSDEVAAVLAALPPRLAKRNNGSELEKNGSP